MKKIPAFLYAFTPYLLVEALTILIGVILPMLSVLILMGLAMTGSSPALQEMMNITENADYNNFISCAYCLIAIPFFGMWYYSRCGGSFRIRGREVSIPLQIASMAVIVSGLQLMSSYICLAIEIVSPSMMEQYNELIDSMGIASDTTLWVVLYSVVFAPVCEELVFRGVTLRLFERVFPAFWPANLLQALLFGLFHGNWVQGIYAFVLGTILGLYCEKGGSIWCSILLHMLFNSWAFFMPDLLALLPDALWVDLLLTVVMVLSLAGGFLLFYISNRPGLYGEEEEQDN